MRLRKAAGAGRPRCALRGMLGRAGRRGASAETPLASGPTRGAFLISLCKWRPPRVAEGDGGRGSPPFAAFPGVRLPGQETQRAVAPSAAPKGDVRAGSSRASSVTASAQGESFPTTCNWQNTVPIVVPSPGWRRQHNALATLCAATGREGGDGWCPWLRAWLLRLRPRVGLTSAPAALPSRPLLPAPSCLAHRSEHTPHLEPLSIPKLSAFFTLLGSGGWGRCGEFSSLVRRNLEAEETSFEMCILKQITQMMKIKNPRSL